MTQFPNFHKHTKKGQGNNSSRDFDLKQGGIHMDNLQDFSWNWFKKSGHPGAYMEYLKTAKPSKESNRVKRDGYI